MFARPLEVFMDFLNLSEPNDEIRVITGQFEEDLKVNGAKVIDCINELSANLPLQNKDVCILRSLCRGNSGIYLAICENRLVVVKEHVFTAGSYLLTSNILYEICTLLYMFHARQTVFHQVEENIPSLLQIETARNSLRLIVEYIPFSVEEICDRRLPVPFLENLSSRLFKLMELLHSIGLFHRDIKPSNLRFRADGSPVLIDYDSCKSLTEEHKNLTGTFPICTITARPPELLLPNPDLPYNASALDVFSLGLLLVYMANTSRAIFHGENSKELLVQMQTELPHFPYPNLCQRLGPRLSTIVKNMLNIDPKLRPTIASINQKWW